MGLSDPFSGDSYSFEADSSPSGFPPRTAFLSRDELSEDSRLLQQILKESEEEIAASAAERANGYSGGGGGTSSGSRIVADRGSAGGGEYPGAGFEDDPSLQSLDVDKIIESMELETFQDDDEAIGFSGIIAGVSGNGGGGVSLRRGSTPSWRTTVTTSRTSSASRRRSSTGEVDGATDTSRTGGIRGVGDSEASAPAASAAVARRASTDSGVGGGANFGLVAAKTSLGGRPADDEDRFATEPLRAGEGSVAGVSSSRWRSQSGRLVGSGETGGSSGGGDWSLTEALRKAESAELRLLRGGNRDVVSPLQVCRRRQFEANATHEYLIRFSARFFYFYFLIRNKIMRKIVYSFCDNWEHSWHSSCSMCLASGNQLTTLDLSECFRPPRPAAPPPTSRVSSPSGQAADACSYADESSRPAIIGVSRRCRRRQRRGGSCSDGEPGRRFAAVGEERGLWQARSRRLHGDGGTLEVHCGRHFEGTHPIVRSFSGGVGGYRALVRRVRRDRVDRGIAFCSKVIDASHIIIEVEIHYTARGKRSGSTVFVLRSVSYYNSYGLQAPRRLTPPLF